MSTTPKILYVEDELAQNIPRLLRLFEKYLSKTEQQRLDDLQKDLEGYGASSDEIKQIFKDIQFIDIEYRFPDALAKALKSPETYSLFIIDRNLADAAYTLEEVQKIDPNYTQDLRDRFLEREGDYILLKLAMTKQVDVLKKFYFLTAYSVEHEVRCSPEIVDYIQFGAFKQDNFVEKGNPEDIQRLKSEIEQTPLQKEDVKQISSSLIAGQYAFRLKDDSFLKGAFVAPALRIQTKDKKLSLNPGHIRKITRLEQFKNAEFKFELKSGEELRGRILDKRLIINTSIDPKYEIISEHIQSIELG